MGRTWLSVTVELLGGRGQELWPWPGRVFAVGPSHTFMDLADSVNEAFARWDRSHLSVFTLADGRVVADLETGAEMAESIGGPILGRGWLTNATAMPIGVSVSPMSVTASRMTATAPRAVATVRCRWGISGRNPPLRGPRVLRPSAGDDIPDHRTRDQIRDLDAVRRLGS